MSDVSQGPGWWQASDTKWYPPQQLRAGLAAVSDAPAQASPQPPRPIADILPGSTPDLRDYGRTLWRHRWLIIFITVIAIGGAVGFSVTQTPVYQATVTIVLGPNYTLGSTQDTVDPVRNVDTQTAVLESKALQQAAKARLGHQPDISISANGATSEVVSVSARSTNARRAARDVNGYVAAYLDFQLKQSREQLAQAVEPIEAKISEIEQSIRALPVASPELAPAEQEQAFLEQQLDQLKVSANLNQAGGTQVLANADVPTRPVLPQPVRDATIALVLGLFLGIGLAFLREYLDDTITSREDLERVAAALPMLGEIPPVPRWRDRKKPYLVTLDEPNSPAAEGYRTLRTLIQFLGAERPLKTIQVTSPSEGDGKTTTLANLAVEFARAGLSVTIVCCDLRQPRIHEFFGLANEVGLTSLLLGETSALDALRRVPGEANIVVLSAGPPSPVSCELLSSERMREVLAAIEEGSDVVLVDSPAVLPVSDALIVSGMVDATLLVAMTNASSSRRVHRSIELLRQVHAPLVGTVLNNATAVETYGTYGYSDPDPHDSNHQTTRLRRPRERTRARSGSGS
jgi:polysaccharide biosynthesis transport protein